ncbi:MAG: TonB-dependent receptor [Methylococcales bacterium]
MRPNPTKTARQGRKPLFKLTGITAAILAGSFALPVMADSAIQTYNIPVQPLDNALTELADNANLKLLYQTEVVSNQKSHALSGRYSAQQALDIMLKNTGLKYRNTGDNAITVEKNPNILVADNAAPSPSTTNPKTAKPTNSEPTLLAPLTVTEAAITEDDTQSSPTLKDVNAPNNKDYKVTNAVTATKTDTPIMQTPMSVKVVSQQVLKDQQVITLEQALRNVSGVASGGQGSFFTRGFQNYNIYRDGFLNQSNWFHQEDLANVERVEVIKGSGSVLYGRTEPGGLVNFVTKEPLDTPYYSLRQQFGSYSLYRTNIDASGPLTANKDLAYRFNLGYQSNNTFQDFGGNERLFVAPTIRWKINDRTTSTLKLEYSDIKETGRGTVPLMGNRPAPIARSTNLGDPWNLQEDEYVMVSLNTEHLFNDNWKLRHRFNFSNHELTMSGSFPDGDFSPVQDNGDQTRSFFAQNIDGKDYIHNFFNALELTGKFNTGFAKHTLLMGADYYHSETRYTNAGFGANPNHYDSTNIYAPIHAGNAPAIMPEDITTYNATLPWFGLYAQDQIELPYNVHVMGGFRYDNAEFDLTSVGEYGGDPVSNSEDKISPRGGVVWQPIPELSLYGSYTENFGASNTFNQGIVLPPQTAQQWETGIKTELLNGRFSATLAYFELTKQQIPVAVRQGLTQAAGEQESRGIELDLSGEILPGWNVIAAYAYTPFAETTQDGFEANKLGKRLNNAPRNSGSLWTTYEFQSGGLQGLKFGGGMQAVGQREIGYSESAQAPGYVTANLMLSKLWQIGASRITTQLNIDNLLDKTYTGRIYSYGPTDYGAPRTFMGSIKLEF